MSTLLFANNAQTTLAGPIAAGALSVNLAAGTGSEFPSVGVGSYFVMTLTDAATGLLHEIVFVTARTGDTLTVQRAQEGTTARSWLAGDIAGNWWTAGSAATMVQVQTLQTQPGNYAVDTGSVNNIRISLNPSPATLATIAGAPIRVLVAFSNTSATTLTIAGLSSVIVFAQSGSTSVLPAGSIIGGQIYEFTYVPSVGFEVSTAKVLLSTSNRWEQTQFLTNGTYWSGQNTSGVTQRLLGVDGLNQTTMFASPSGTTAWRVANNAGTANLVYTGATGGFHAIGGMVADTGDIVSATGNVVASTRLRAGSGAFGSGDPNAATLLGDFVRQIGGASPNSYINERLPDGTIIQSYTGTTITGADFITFPTPFPNTCVEVVACEGAPGGWIVGGVISPTIFGTQQPSASSFALYCARWTPPNWQLAGAITFRYIAIGF